MNLDIAALGRLAADLMDRLEADYGAGAEGLELMDAVLIVELADVKDSTIIRWRSTTNRASVNAGLAAVLHQAYVEGDDIE